MGGETSTTHMLLMLLLGLSPRGRGNLQAGGCLEREHGSIPAWAGKPDLSTSDLPAGRVYPRVGGETVSTSAGVLGGGGLSPRGRGNPGHAGAIEYPRRSIPAWAGKPSSPGCCTQSARVYPRVGGETTNLSVNPLAVEGLSPRGRGNLPANGMIAPDSRSIPAWAGKPGGRGRGGSVNGVYPRVGGETRPEAGMWVVDGGLSPRGRGNPAMRMRGASSMRSIPAWAGKPGHGRASTP